MILLKERGMALFKRLGSELAVDMVVETFFDKITTDERIKHFFENVDMKRQREKQKIFLTHAFGGSMKYTGPSMREVHKDLVEKKGLNETHFNALVEDLLETLRELHLPEHLIEEVMKIIMATKKDVLNL